jgi:hypothetical protein
MGERWWRAYDGAMHDPKLKALSPRAFRFWFNLLCIASQNDGVIPPLAIVVRTLSVRSRDAERFVSELTANGLIDQIEGRLEPHNWRKRQYKSDLSTDRVDAHRKRFRNVSETPPETDTETERDKNSYKEYKNSISCTDTVFPIVPGQPEWEAWERYFLDRKKPLPLAMQRVKDGMQKAMTVKTRFPPS